MQASDGCLWLLHLSLVWVQIYDVVSEGSIHRIAVSFIPHECFGYHEVAVLWTGISALESLAAHRTIYRKVMKSGTLTEMCMNINHSKFGVLHSVLLAPPTVQTYTRLSIVNNFLPFRISPKNILPRTLHQFSWKLNHFQTMQQNYAKLISQTIFK